MSENVKTTGNGRSSHKNVLEDGKLINLSLLSSVIAC